MAIAGNKNDMYEYEEVEENEGKSLANELGAVFQRTSAKQSMGVEELFIKIGKKFVNQNKSDYNINKNENKSQLQKLKAVSNKNEEGKKGCC